jgi:hypothetical protein
MTPLPSREDKLREAFLVLGSQYFAHARYSSQIFYLPVSATLFHHAIEMLIKGYLIKFMKLSELKKIGHDLEKLWEMFKVHASRPDLIRYDQSIKRLNQIELIRYPETIVDKGYALHLSLGSPSIPMDIPGTNHVPQYQISVSDLDNVATEIYSECGVSPKPYFNSAPIDFKRALPWDVV